MCCPCSYGKVAHSMDLLYVGLIFNTTVNMWRHSFYMGVISVNITLLCLVSIQKYFVHAAFVFLYDTLDVKKEIFLRSLILFILLLSTRKLGWQVLYCIETMSEMSLACKWTIISFCRIFAGLHLAFQFSYVWTE